jgi:hypothetical protein
MPSTHAELQAARDPDAPYYCATCEKRVAGVHSCFDAAALRAHADHARRVAEAERAVVEAAVAWEEACSRNPIQPMTQEVYSARHGLLTSVRVLRALTPTPTIKDAS